MIDKAYDVGTGYIARVKVLVGIALGIVPCGTVDGLYVCNSVNDQGVVFFKHNDLPFLNGLVVNSLENSGIALIKLTRHTGGCYNQQAVAELIGDQHDHGNCHSQQHNRDN